MLVFAFLLALLVSCSQASPTMPLVKVTITDVDGAKIVEVAPGSTVQNALDRAGAVINNLDRTDPPSYTLITVPIEVKLTRVTEKFEVEESIIPFTRQTVRNESLPEGQTLLIQPGVNGKQRITHRVVFENGVQSSRTEFKREITAEPLPEIIMVGVQAPFTPVSISGRIAYITAGNAWVMENSTGDRRPVITTGDLDGRVFSLSDDSNWLLFTRSSKKKPEEEINSLWMANIALKNPQPISLRVMNVVHFADWMPGKALRVAFSTVEPRATAPGWQANNDLILLTVNDTGGILSRDEIITASSGGIYGWWGTTYACSSDGREIAYARPDSIGIVDITNKQLVPLLDIIPFQTRSDWAWVPGISWSPDNQVIYTVNHTPMTGLTSAEVSPLFDFIGVVVNEDQPITLVAPVGMFAYPASGRTTKGDSFEVAYLQAIFPEQSDTSRYRLMIMDRDGSNRKVLFPPEGSPGLDPQQVIWGPSSDEGSWLAFVYQGDLWLANTRTEKAQQITGDGSIGKIDWQ